jgi:hypothetical protein
MGGFCFENNITHTRGDVMKKFIGSYYRSSFNVCLWAFLSLISLMFLSSSAFAQQSGDFTYQVSAFTVTITKYTGTGGNVVIPATIDSMPVLKIGEYAFYRCRGLTSVTIPNSVTSIEEYAFDGCIGLTSVTIGNSVTSIGVYAFEWCSGLTSVTIGNSVTSIGDAAFSGCTNLTSVTIPNSVTSIGNEAFDGCIGLTSVTIGNSVTSIGEYAFVFCGLTSVTIGNSVTSIGFGAFEYCRSLTSVTIPNSVTNIGICAFLGCSSLTRAYFSGSAPSMGSGVFEDCASNFSVCYTAESTGFTTPTWNGYPAAVCASTTTIPAHQCPAETIYGNNSEETELLREYRDKVLSKSATGRQMIKTYYELSPAVAEVLQQNETAKSNARRVLDSLMPAIREKVKQ